MIDALLACHVSQATLSEQTSPDHIPGCTSHMTEASHLKSIDHAVVRMRAVRDLEAECTVWLQLVLCVLNDA